MITFRQNINQTNHFVPDYAIPPGETLLDTIEALGMSQAELSERTGRPKKTINEIINGKAPITPDTALQLERVLGVSAAFWNNLGKNYRETLARLAEQERLQGTLTQNRNLESQFPHPNPPPPGEGMKN